MPQVALISWTVVEPLPRFIALAGGTLGPDRVSKALGNTPDVHGEKHVSIQKTAALFETLANDLAMPDLGLRYASAFPLGGTGALGYLLTHGRDLRTAVEAMSRYLAILTDGVDATFEATPGGATLTWTYRRDMSGPFTQFNSFAAALLVLRLRSCLSDDWRPRRVQLAQRAPADIDPYRRMFGPDICFGERCNRLTFSDVNLDRPNFAADSRLYAVIQKLADILLQQRPSDTDFCGVVINALVDQFGVSMPSLAGVADQLKLSMRTVQRRLSAQGTSYEELLDSTRRSIADRLLSDTDVPMTDIAFLLGFSELSAFTRAARRWYGVSPRRYRESSH